MDSLTMDDNIDNGTKKAIYISPFRANKEQTKKSPKPVIRGLKIITPDDDLLKRLRIQDEDDKDYKANRHLMDTDYQILSGEVEVNGVVFNLYLVISKSERIFTQDVINNSNLSKEEKKEYLNREYISLFEDYILRCFEDLSKVDPEVLEVIRIRCNPDIVFKTRMSYDYSAVANPRWGAYVGRGNPHGVKRTTNINFYYKEGTPIVHEFGHLFDYACRITDGERQEEWEKLAHKYSAALKLTTRCGNYLSGYTEKDYQKDVQEFFADLFAAYYTGDKVKGGSYLIELLDKDALNTLENEISSATYESKPVCDTLEYDLFIYHNVELLIEYFENANDLELANLISDFIALCDSQIYKIGNNTNMVTVNEVMYSYVVPMLKRVINICNEYKKESTEDNRELIKDAITSFTKEIKDYVSLEFNTDKKEYKDLSIEEEVSVSSDSTRTLINKSHALIRLNAITDYLFSPEARFPKDFRDEIIERKNVIYKKIMELSDDGLTDIEFKVIINSIHNIIESMRSFNPTVYRARVIRKKLLTFYEKITNHLKDDPDNETYKGYCYLLERMMEFFENEDILKEFDVESDIFVAMSALERKLNQHMEIPVNKLKPKGYQELENFFDFVHESLELDGYTRIY